MYQCKLLTISTCFLALTALAASPTTFAAPSSTKAASSDIIDKQKELDRFTFWDNKDWAWYKKNIPFIDTPDADIDETYYYRWQLLTKHMVYVNPALGYAFSEFICRPGGYGMISCASGHHIDDLRWLKDRRVTQDYIQYWYKNPNAFPRSYSNWYDSAIWSNYLVDNDKPFLLAQLPDMKAQYDGWMKVKWDPTHQMFHSPGMEDGMENTIESRQTSDSFRGADNYRPTLNSYIYGDLNAIANTAELSGDQTTADEYRQKADALKAQVEQQLWDPKRQFFISQFGEDNTLDGYTVKALSLVYQDGKYAGDPHGREITGYVPWMFDLPDKNKGYEVAWKGMTDPNVFLAPYGFYFVEKHDPMFLVTHGGCSWSGNNWPYADAEVLTAMANVLNDYPQQTIGNADYFKALSSYTICQRKGGQPYDAECGDPDTGIWTQDSPGWSDDYNHSSYIDLILTGLLGLRPRPDNEVVVNPLAPESWNYFAADDILYHGFHLAVVWDRDGTHYGIGKGLRIIVNGKTIASSSTLGKLTGNLPSETPVTAPIDRPIDFAVNNDGNYFPKINTSYTSAGTSAGYLNDGTYFYNVGHPINRWDTAGSTNSSDSINLDFGDARPLEQIKLYLLDDGPGQPVRAPASFTVQYSDNGVWRDIPGQVRTPVLPEGRRPNIIDFPTLDVSQLRVTLTPQSGSAVGASELEAWGHADLPLSAGHLPPDDLALQATATASYTWQEDSPAAINDGIISMNGGARNRWTAYKTTNATDYVQLAFPNPVTVGRMEMCFWADNGGVRLPTSYQIQYWDGTAWQNFNELSRNPLHPTRFVSNEIIVTPVQTTKLRLNLVNDPAGGSGITEWMVWKQ